MNWTKRRQKSTFILTLNLRNDTASERERDGRKDLKNNFFFPSSTIHKMSNRENEEMKIIKMRLMRIGSFLSLLRSFCTATLQ